MFKIRRPPASRLRNWKTFLPRAARDEPARRQLPELWRENCISLVEQCADGLRILQINSDKDRPRSPESRASRGLTREQFSHSDRHRRRLSTPQFCSDRAIYLRLRSGILE